MNILEKFEKIYKHLTNIWLRLKTIEARLQALENHK